LRSETEAKPTVHEPADRPRVQDRQRKPSGRERRAPPPECRQSAAEQPDLEESQRDPCRVAWIAGQARDFLDREQDPMFWKISITIQT
jgi:hypothetical protein